MPVEDIDLTLYQFNYCSLYTFYSTNQLNIVDGDAFLKLAIAIASPSYCTAHSGWVFATVERIIRWNPLLEPDALLLKLKVRGQGTILRMGCFASVCHSPPNPNPNRNRGVHESNQINYILQIIRSHKDFIWWLCKSFLYNPHLMLISAWSWWERSRGDYRSTRQATLVASPVLSKNIIMSKNMLSTGCFF